LRPEEFRPGWDFVELQFEKTVSFKPEWRNASTKFAVHSPYYVSLTSPKQQKVDEAINKIIDSAKVGEKLGATIVVARAGFYSKRTPAETMDDMVRNCRETTRQLRIQLGIETQPRQTQFGSLEEVLQLAEKTGIVPVINLGAIRARSGELDIKRVLSRVDEPYIHFDSSIDLEALAAALPRKYTLVAEDAGSAEKMRALL